MDRPTDWLPRQIDRLVELTHPLPPSFPTPPPTHPAVNECLHEYTSDAAFEAWKLKRADRLEKEGKVIEVGPGGASK